jgi:hypothetical protein
MFIWPTIRLPLWRTHNDMIGYIIPGSAKQVEVVPKSEGLVSQDANPSPPLGTTNPQNSLMKLVTCLRRGEERTTAIRPSCGRSIRHTCHTRVFVITPPYHWRCSPTHSGTTNLPLVIAVDIRCPPLALACHRAVSEIIFCVYLVN